MSRTSRAPRDRRAILRLLLAGMAWPMIGCGDGGAPAGSDVGLHPVSGRVLVGGKPAVGVEVRLHPINRTRDDAAARPSAATDKDGRFRLRTGDAGEGAPNGQYLATLVWPGARGGADRFGDAFAEPEGSGLTAVIDESTAELPPFEVAGASRGRGGRVSP